MRLNSELSKTKKLILTSVPPACLINVVCTPRVNVAGCQRRNHKTDASGNRGHRPREVDVDWGRRTIGHVIRNGELSVGITPPVLWLQFVVCDGREMCRNVHNCETKLQSKFNIHTCT